MWTYRKSDGYIYIFIILFHELQVSIFAVILLNKSEKPTLCTGSSAWKCYILNFHISHYLGTWLKGNSCTCSLQYSLDELEEMMLCLQQFCSVLSNMEEQLTEDQAAVYSALSDQDRYMLKLKKLFEPWCVPLMSALKLQHSQQSTCYIQFPFWQY